MSAHEQFADDLALYALGTLGGTERAALEAHLEQCAACRRELDELKGDIGLLGLTTASAAAPPARARERLMSAVAREPYVRTIRKRSLRWWLAVVPVAAALVLAAVSVVFWRQNRTLRQDLAEQIARFQQNQAELERSREVRELLSAPDAVRVTLIGTNAKPQPEGKAIYRQRTGSLVFLASNFAPLPPEKAYELWLVPASGAAPIPAGVFKPDAQGSASVLMPALPKDLEAKAFAITVEPEAGSSSPTMPILFVGGR